jgi:uncharacterized FlgJ-related protein
MKLHRFNSEKLIYEPVNKFKYLGKYIGITIGILVSIGIFSSFRYTEQIKTEYIHSEEVINLITNESFSREKFIEEVVASGFKFPEIIIAQAYIESEHFKSPVWKENNNMLGMRLATTRFTLATGENLKHAVFKNWKDCVKDRLIYEALYLNKLNKQQYYHYLDHVYARAKGKTAYTDLIKQVIKQNKLDEKVQIN